MSRRVRRGGGKGRLGSGRGCGGQINLNISNNINKRQEPKFYLHGTGSDIPISTLTKVKDRLILEIQSEFVNGINLIESIRKGEILYLIK